MNKRKRRGVGHCWLTRNTRTTIATRINNLTEHMRTHEKDYASRRGLLAMVSRRRSLLDYLRRVNAQGYVDIIGKLGIRK